MAEKEATQFRLSPATRRRLAALAIRLGKTKTDVLETAVVHLLATLDRGETGVFLEAPSEVGSDHKTA